MLKSRNLTGPVLKQLPGKESLSAQQPSSTCEVRHSHLMISRQPLTFALPSWCSFNVQIYKAGNGCRWLESRLAVITGKNEQSTLGGEPRPSAPHTPGAVSTEGPPVMPVFFTQLKKLWLTIGLSV